MKYWEIVADNFKKAGWRCGCISGTHYKGRQFLVVAAGREETERFIVHADEILTAFLELESAIRTVSPSNQDNLIAPGQPLASSIG